MEPSPENHEATTVRYAQAYLARDSRLNLSTQYETPKRSCDSRYITQMADERVRHRKPFAFAPHVRI